MHIDYMISTSQFKKFTTKNLNVGKLVFFKFDVMVCKWDSLLIPKTVPDDLGGDADPLPLLPEGLIEASG